MKPKINVVTADWMPKDSAMFVSNGEEAIVKLDLADKTGRATIKEPKAVLITNIKGDAPFMAKMKRLWRNK